MNLTSLGVNFCDQLFLVGRVCAAHSKRMAHAAASSASKLWTQWCPPMRLRPLTAHPRVLSKAWIGVVWPISIRNLPLNVVSSFDDLPPVSISLKEPLPSLDCLGALVARAHFDYGMCTSIGQALVRTVASNISFLRLVILLHILAECLSERVSDFEESNLVNLILQVV